MIFRVYGKPAQQGSKRLVPTGAGPRLCEDNDVKKKAWRNAVATAAAEEMDGANLMDGPLVLGVTFMFQRPQSHYGSGRNSGKLKPSAPEHHAQSPDLDKLIRNVSDALTGIVYRDDRQVVQIEAKRAWTEQQEGAVVSVTELPGAYPSPSCESKTP